MAATTTKKKATTTTAKKTTTRTAAKPKEVPVEEPILVEEEPVVEEPEEEIFEEEPVLVKEPEPEPEPPKPVEPPKKEPRQFNQHDLILCRSVTAGWLGCGGKSGQYYIFENFGDECEIEYQDLFALKQRRSPYLYSPLFVIEDEELLENPRWTDIQKFYDEKVYTMEDIDATLNIPIAKFEDALKKLPKGLAKSLQVEVAKRIEDGTFDSLKKIRVIDEVFGTDFRSILAE